MDIKLNDPNNFKYIQYIENAIDNGFTYEDLKTGSKFSNGLEGFLETQKINFWNISVEDWIELVEIKEKIDQESFPATIALQEKLKQAPPSKFSMWQNYKKRLINNNLDGTSISKIEKSVRTILGSMCEETKIDNPVRGMVVGNVQSGKTANMAGVIAMAADYGYNFIIVLTGTIDNLRIQTKERLFADLNNDKTNIKLNFLEKPCVSRNYSPKLSELLISEQSNNVYLSVCLKNSSWLQKLNKYLNSDLNVKEKLKVLIIDDEADSAGINTRDITTDEQSKINNCIRQIVFGKKVSKGIIEKNPYKSMNYIGYTATPYANLLNEYGDESLYPHNFITVLDTPTEYIGPEQIFGSDENLETIDVVNIIPQDDIDYIKQDLFDDGLPESFKKSIMWFIITVALFRYLDLSKPVTMLVHTTHITSKHAVISKTIKDYFNSLDIDKEVGEFESLYEKQMSKLSKDDFINANPRYKNVKDINDYPKFNEIRDLIIKICKEEVTTIMLNEDGALTYSDKIHLCIDNSRCCSSKEEYLRIVYPKDKETLKMCPAFIVVGGSTLSRGLTLEGLTTSYFLRTTRQADTLMQMGRWFGYRKGYELFERIWISEECNEKFKKLSILDNELRNEIKNMELRGLKPSDYGVKIKTFPEYKLLSLTSKNKMQSSIEFETTFYAKNVQIIEYARDNVINKENYDYAIKFLNNLGSISTNDKLLGVKNNKLIWENVSFDKCLDFIGNIKLAQNLPWLINFDNFKDWYLKQYTIGELGDFTVVAGSKSTKGTQENEIVLDNGYKIYKRTRSVYKYSDETFNIKVLNDPNDNYLDINVDVYESKIHDHNIKPKQARMLHASKKNPYLVIYFIDENSTNKPESAPCSIKDLDIKSPIVGYYIYIPYGTGSNADNRGYVVVNMKLYDKEEDVLDEN